MCGKVLDSLALKKKYDPLEISKIIETYQFNRKLAKTSETQIRTTKSRKASSLCLCKLSPVFRTK